MTDPSLCSHCNEEGVYVNGSVHYCIMCGYKVNMEFVSAANYNENLVGV